jgi:hypothetical protein
MTRMNKDGRTAGVTGLNTSAGSGVAGDGKAEERAVGGVVICMTGSANMVIERTKIEGGGEILISPEGDGITMRRVRWD